MCAMNSSVTFDSATSVMSSLCLAISVSSRSKGPSKLSRRTRNPPSGASWAVMGAPGRAPASLFVGSWPPDGSGLAEPLHQHAGLAVLLEVGEQHRDSLPHDPAAVGGQSVVGAQGQPGLLQGEQF